MNVSPECCPSFRRHIKVLPQELLEGGASRPLPSIRRCGGVCSMRGLGLDTQKSRVRDKGSCGGTSQRSPNRTGREERKEGHVAKLVTTQSRWLVSLGEGSTLMSASNVSAAGNLGISEVGLYYFMGSFKHCHYGQLVMSSSCTGSGQGQRLVDLQWTSHVSTWFAQSSTSGQWHEMLYATASVIHMPLPQISTPIFQSCFFWAKPFTTAHVSV